MDKAGYAMMGYIIAGIIAFSVITAAFRGNMDSVSTAALQGCGDAVQLILSLAGLMCLWCGVLNIASHCGLTEKLARLFRPLTRRLFPTLSQEGPAMQAICMNLSANLLGLGNAATPLGIAAMQELQKANLRPDTASDAMLLFVVLNTASLQLIPTTNAYLRLQAGSVAPMEILPCVWIASVCSITVGILVALLPMKKGHL